MTVVANVAAVLAGLKKGMGPHIGDFGTALHECERIPSGIFAFDLATGGGVPRGRITEIFGPNSSGKTNLCLKLIAAHQKLFPDQVCVFLDLEHSLDGPWAQRLGVDVSKLLWMKPAVGEQVVDMMEGFIMADDIGLIVLDSLGAMVGDNELASDGAKAVVGGSSLLVGKLTRKTVYRQSQAETLGRSPTVVCINQIRFRIGTVRGDPEDTPGGNGYKHACNMRVRLYGKDVEEGRVSTVLPTFKQTQFIIRKNKVPILSKNGMYDMVLLAHDGLAVGDCADVNPVLGFMKKGGLLVKGEKGGWLLKGEPFKTLDPIKERLVGDKVWGLSIRSEVIRIMLAGGGDDGQPVS